MATDSKIQWCDDTRNLWWGCTKKNAGCKNCYADALSNRYSKVDLWGDNAKRKLLKKAFTQFDVSENKAIKEGRIRRVFVGSMMDIFEDSKPMIDHENQDILSTTGIIRKTFFETIVPNMKHLDFLLLTKRPKNINNMIPDYWRDNPPKNVMFGASVANTKTMHEVARELHKVNGRKFWSVEPLVEKIDLSEVLPLYDMPDWIIVGGESGPKKRPFNADWARLIRDQCKELGIAFFMKQIDKVQTIPDDLMIREFSKEYVFESEKIKQ